MAVAVRYLLDTCTFIWLVCEPEKLSAACRGIINDQHSMIWCSDVVCLEIVLKWRAGKLKLPEEPRTWYEDQMAIWKFPSLQLARHHIYRTSELEMLHRDPFDRLLVGQSISEGMVLVTPDAAIRQYPVAVIW